MTQYILFVNNLGNGASAYYRENQVPGLYPHGHLGELSGVQLGNGVDETFLSISAKSILLQEILMIPDAHAYGSGVSQALPCDIEIFIAIVQLDNLVRTGTNILLP